MQSAVAKNMDAKHRREAPKSGKAFNDMDEKEKQDFIDRFEDFGRKAGAEKLAAMITKLEGKWEFNGSPLKAGDTENLEKAIAAESWLADQLIAHAKDVVNYTPKN